MKADTLRAFTTLHTWTGLVAGLALFIAFYAGAITVFHGELHAWEQPDLRGEPMQTTNQVDALRAAVLDQHPGAIEELTILLPGFDGPRAAAFWRSDGDRHDAGLAPDGTLTEAAPLDSELAAHVNFLHFTLGLPASIGMWLMGLVCAIYGVALVSGIVIHLPTLVESLFAIRPGRNIKRFWQDAHNVIGVLSLPFHVIFAFTGALLTVLTVFVAGLAYVALDERVAERFQSAFEIVAEPAAAGEPLAAPGTAALIARAKDAIPGMTPFLFRHHQSGDSAGITVVHGAIGERLANRVAVAIRHDDLGIAETWGPGTRPATPIASSVITSLHYGNFGGPVIKWLYFLLGLGGAFLFYSGNLLWIESRRRRRQREQPRLHRAMAGVTVGVCIGCCLGVSGLFLANKLLPEALADRAAWEMRVYYLLFLGSVAWALLRAPARGAVELLLATSALTAAIPLVNWAVAGDHPWSAIHGGQWAVAGIDIVALAGAAAFALLARATHRRARDGNPNSVWHGTAGRPPASAAPSTAGAGST